MMLYSELKTILIGDLQDWMDSHHLVTSFSTGGEMYCADVIKNKQTGQSLGYGFIEFGSRSASERFLKRHQGTIVPSNGQYHRMDWTTCNIVERHSWLTGRSMSYGFVSFADEGEQMRAITEMHGVLCSTRPMRIELATNEKPAATTQSKGFTFNAVERSSRQDDGPES
ncbi:hypothetical protein P8452_12259 [Trifolium repens]|nr:hypothetical protein P8452_12259 [Trifolium repens]